MSNLAILNTSIRSHENLFSLNDLHQASGGKSKHQPSFFIRLDTTKDLVAEIEKDSETKALKTIRGTQGGTYACEELVIAYAMWISPKFHLIVLRAFLNLHKKSTALLPNTITPEQQQAIQSAVQQAHHRTGLHWQEIYRQLKAMFHIAKYDQLPQNQFGNAMAFIMSLQPIALPPAEEIFTFDLTKEEISNLTLLLFSHGQMNWLLGKLVKPLEAIGSSYSPTVCGHHTEYKRFYDKSLPVARKLIEPLKQTHRADFEHLLYRLSAN
ncbi:KilA-N domain-containing protein [Haemophilus pittmaniae]|uniref:KilA-N domain-containing protein n=1 Tax=Haemophilus pittmaniae TaxID=249188 RepID=UPI0028DC50B5|nr:KilA-N domain-containing protein [Haemophilus pittmaniae]